MSFRGAYKLLSHLHQRNPIYNGPESLKDYLKLYTLAARMPRRCLFLGAPGVGKGTYSRLALSVLNIKEIAAGDIIRNEIKSKTPLGHKFVEYANKGDLIPDSMINNLIFNKLSDSQYEKGVLLDGFPRNISQAKELDKRYKLDLVLNITLPEDVLLEKLLGRRICSKCGEGYNIANIQRDGIDMPPLLPKVDCKCDKCGGELIERKDDNEEVIKQRFKVYNESTSPLIDYYRKKNILQEFNVKLGVKDMCNCMEVITKGLLGRWINDNEEIVLREFGI